jgi:hypothetical protein
MMGPCLDSSFVPFPAGILKVIDATFESVGTSHVDETAGMVMPRIQVCDCTPWGDSLSCHTEWNENPVLSLRGNLAWASSRPCVPSAGTDSSLSLGACKRPQESVAQM